MWYDEKTRVVIMVTLERLDLTPYELHEGPPVYNDGSIKFVEKYLDDPEALGPFILGSRLYVVKRRKYDKVEKLLQAQLPQIAPKHLKKLVQKARIYRVENLRDVEKLDADLRDVVLRFLFKRPEWLGK